MRILLFAYEFPPILSAQSLRWYYLANELAGSGVEIDVVTPLLRDVWNFHPKTHASISLHRCFPGPYVALSGWVAGRLDSNPGEDAAGRSTAGSLEPMYRATRRLLDNIVFPDVRSEWWPFAWRKARELHAAREYRLVISSHEPGVDLLLGLMAKRRWKIPWIVDLADPVVTPYTPRWRKRLDGRLERYVCATADEILVTTEGAEEILCERHGIGEPRFRVIRQGYDHRSINAEVSAENDLPAGRFTLVFTGNFYKRFRDPGCLIAALRKQREIDLIVAGDVTFEREFRTLGNRVRLLGRRSHDQCVELQRNASVLLSLGNVQSYQVPGKIYEYLGAHRPILHVANGQGDPARELLGKTGRGVVVENDVGAIAEAIEQLQAQWREDVLDQHFNLCKEAVAEFSWANQGERLFRVLNRYIT